MKIMIKATAIHNGQPIVKTIESGPDVLAGELGRVAEAALREACEDGCDPVETTLILSFREAQNETLGQD